MQRHYPLRLKAATRVHTARPIRNLIRSNSTASPGAAKPESKPLSWPEYFSIRKAKRRWEVATTIPMALGGLTAGGVYFGNMDDVTTPIMGIEPIWVYSAATVGCFGLGYLLGPFVGSSFWRMTHGRAIRLIEARDREFHHHIIKNRVDPSRQSATNPVPDYYGEKVLSLHQYRQWLRDQAKFRRKAERPEE